MTERTFEARYLTAVDFDDLALHFGQDGCYSADGD